ncbi:hypothetical protein L6164_018973 [Bauhinia variegata]|uniref:Uncharacterized protein n=1 Tax=Bauhinia variegata TaxID=167791 RepID=A0ACB9NEA1_BAUVA|nr:hypothetical protein L6164_018973 [Bauhinia variegata]
MSNSISCKLRRKLYATDEMWISKRFVLLLNYMEEPLDNMKLCWMSTVNRSDRSITWTNQSLYSGEVLLGANLWNYWSVNTYLIISCGNGLQMEYTKSLFAEGVVNDQFNRIHCLKKSGEADSVIKLIESYFADVDKIISEVSCNLDTPHVDFDMLTSLVQEIEDKSSSLGAELVKGACINLVKASNQKQKDSFEGALCWIKSEFAQTKNKLERFVQMEKRIIRLLNSRT